MTKEVPGDGAPAAPRVWSFSVAGHPLSPNRAAVVSLRIRLRDKKAYRDAVAWSVRQVYRGRPLERAHVTVTLVRPDNQFYDSDALGFLAKHPIDGLVTGGLLVDDGPDHVALTLHQERGARRMVEIVVQEVEGEVT